MKKGYQISEEDYSDRLYTIQYRYSLAAVIAIFITAFQLDAKSRLFGFYISDLNERLIESGAILIALTLGTSYWTRFYEERDVYKSLDRIISTQIESAGKVLEKFESTFSYTKDSVSTARDQDRKILSSIKRIETVMVMEIENLKAQRAKNPEANYRNSLAHDVTTDVNLAARLVSEQLEKISERYSKLEEETDSIFSHLDTVSEELKGIRLDPSLQRITARKRKLRIIIFDAFIPFMLFISLIACFVFRDFATSLNDLLSNEQATKIEQIEQIENGNISSTTLFDENDETADSNLELNRNSDRVDEKL